MRKLFRCRRPRCRPPCRPHRLDRVPGPPSLPPLPWLPPTTQATCSRTRPSTWTGWMGYARCCCPLAALLPAPPPPPPPPSPPAAAAAPPPPHCAPTAIAALLPRRCCGAALATALAVAALACSAFAAATGASNPTTSLKASWKDPHLSTAAPPPPPPPPPPPGRRLRARLADRVCCSPIASAAPRLEPLLLPYALSRLLPVIARTCMYLRLTLAHLSCPFLSCL